MDKCHQCKTQVCSNARICKCSEDYEDNERNIPNTTRSSKPSFLVDNIANIGIEGFIKQQNSYLQFESIWWSLVQGSNAQPTELAWHVSVGDL